MDDATRDSALHTARPAARGSWRGDLAAAVATGLVTTYVPVQRWSRTARWGLHGGMGVVAAAGTAVLLRHPEWLVGPDERPEHAEPADHAEHADAAPRLRPLAVTAVALAIGGVATGVSRGGESVDAWMERTLVARGVRRPRAWLGVAAAGASLAMSTADRRRTSRGPTGP